MRENRCSFKQFSLGVPGIPLEKWEVVGIFYDKKEWISYLKSNCYNKEILHSWRQETLSQQEPFQFDYTFPCILQEVQLLGKHLTELNWENLPVGED